jgi:hypothetical protein
VNWKIKTTAAIFFLMLVVVCNTQILDPDLGWHIRVGEDILATHSVPRADIYSNSMPEYSWVDHEWLGEIFLGYVYSHNFAWVAVALFSLLTFIPFFVWTLKSRSVFEILFLLVSGSFLVMMFGIRLQIFTFFFFFLVYELLLRKSKYILFLFPLIFLIWGNLNAGFILGLVAFSVFVFYAIQETGFFQQKWAVAILLTSIAAPLVNPYGFNLYGEIFRVFFSSNSTQYIVEWKSVFVIVTELASPIYISVFFSFALVLIISFFCFFSFKYFKRYPKAILVVAAAFFLGFFKSMKFGIVFFTSAVPFFALGTQYVKADFEKAEVQKNYPRLRLLMPVFALIFLPFLILTTVTLRTPKKSLSGYPSPEAVQALIDTQKNTRGSIFNDYGWGGYLMRKAPGLKLFIDGRMPHWKDKNGYSAMEDYVKVFYPKDDKEWMWKDVFARKNISVVAVNNLPCPNIRCKLANTLQENGWSVIYKDESALIIKK